MQPGQQVYAECLSRLLDAVYDAGTGKKRWNGVLEELISAFRADVCSLTRYDFCSGSGAHLFAVPEPAARRRNGGSEAADVHPWPTAIEDARYRVTGSAFRAGLSPSEDAPPRPRRSRTRPRLRDMPHSIRLVVDRSGANAIYISISRSPRQDEFDDRDLVVLEALFPHLRRAFRSWSSHVKALEREDAALRAMDPLAIGVILVDENSQVIYRNAVAGKILADADGISESTSGLELSVLGRRQGIRTTLRRLTDLGNGHSAEPTLSLQIARRSGSRPLSAFVIPIHQTDTLPYHGKPAAIVYLCDPESKPDTDWTHLCRLYGLTLTEAKVAGHLAQGDRVEQIRKALQVSDNTVRTHVQHILNKTSTRRQAELVRLLAAGPAQLRL